jgi:hypothetical protein
MELIGEIVLLGLATYRLTRLFTRDEILSGFRDWFWEKYPPETKKLGYVLTCEWCLSIWVASLLQLSRIIIPIPTNIVALILAMSAIAGLLTAHEDK